MTIDRSTVLDPADGSYVLPSPPRGQGFLVFDDAGTPRSVLHTGSIARGLGERFQSHSQVLHLLLTEVRERLSQLDVGIAARSRT